MTTIINIGIILFVLWLAMQTIGVCFEVAKLIEEKRRPENIQRRRNHIVINGKMFYPKRTGRNIDCKKECKLAQHCRQDGYGLCVTLGAPDDDVIMTDGTDD